MTIRLGSIAVLAALSATGCSSVRVSTDHDPGAIRAMAVYANYCWLPRPEAQSAIG
jgi:hypothetical protein